MRIALAGNPNSGKTTMYNALTGRNEKVGNWAGVTVDKMEAPIKPVYAGDLELTAVDLSDLDKNIDTFQVGDLVQVRSHPHGVDDLFRLSLRVYDLLNPANSLVVLGKDVATLSGSSAYGDKRLSTDMQVIEKNIKADYTLNTAHVIEETKATLLSLIQQTSEEIKLEVSQTYATGDNVTNLVETQFKQLAESFEFRFNTMQAAVDENDAEAREQFDTISKYIRFEDGDIILGTSENELVARVENDRIVFLDDGAEVAYLTNKKLYVTDGHFIHSLRIGSFEWRPRANGNLSLIKVV